MDVKLREEEARRFLIFFMPSILACIGLDYLLATDSFLIHFLGKEGSVEKQMLLMVLEELEFVNVLAGQFQPLKPMQRIHQT